MGSGNRTLDVRWGMNSPADALKRVLEVLDLLEIPYMVGGSTASSVHGIMRPTLDVDIVVDLSPGCINEFVGLLTADFYVDGDTIRRSIQIGRAFNVIHLSTTYKFDFFPLQHTDTFQEIQFGRREYMGSRQFGDEPIEFAVASPEDTILSKLRWYRLGGGKSEKQWRDMEGVLLVQGDRLDRNYLRRWAAHLKVSDLLEKLLTTSAPS
jgi:hypothetical protein